MNVIIIENFLHGQIGIKNTENCAGIRGVKYNFNNKNLISFEDNFGSKADLPFTRYFDFETTAPTDIFDPEQKNCLYFHMF